MAEHFMVQCRGCGAVVEACKCMGNPDEHEIRWIATCSRCMEPEIPASNPCQFQWESYDRSGGSK